MINTRAIIKVGLKHPYPLEICHYQTLTHSTSSVKTHREKKLKRNNLANWKGDLLFIELVHVI